MIAFGSDDPLLRDFKHVLVNVIPQENQVGPEGVWIQGAGHYPMEERPTMVMQLIKKFVSEE
jgi:pimeloyl-ACP methyl ester carboxylesterase